MVAKRGGRPAKPLKAAKALVTRRVRRLVDLAHDGNVHEASKVSGVPSATLRALYSGRNTNPGLRTLERLGEAYGFYPSWFTDPKAPEAVPLGGLSFTVRVPNPPHGMQVVREFTIPWASWPLPEVLRRLTQHLLSLPRSPERPIIGELGDEPEHAEKVAALVATFLIGPLDVARKLTGAEQDGAFTAFDAEDTGAEAHVQRLRRLGRFWEVALSPLLESHARIRGEQDGRG